MPAGLSVVLCVKNGEATIQRRLENLLTAVWQGELEVWVYADGCTDQTVARAREMGDSRVQVIEATSARGKAAGLNATIPKCRHEVVVLCDVRQRFEPEALTRLASVFRDPEVAAVSGLLQIEPSAAGSGQGVDLYWQLERKLRQWEGRFDSVIGCTGAICAIRRDAYEPLPEDTILDDVVIPMCMAMKGGRIYYEETAVAWDPQRLEAGNEAARKRRTLVGNYQMLARYPRWLLPGVSRLWWQLLCHKYLRLLVPWCLLGVLGVSALAVEVPGMKLLLGLQLVSYAAAAVGLMRPEIRWKMLTIPAGFLLLQWTCLLALLAYVRHRHDLRCLWHSDPTPSSDSAA